MKIIGILLLLIPLVICELPPPYPFKNFRTQPFLPPFSSRVLDSYGPPRPASMTLPSSTPHSHYGPPNDVESLDLGFRPIFSKPSIGKQITQYRNSPYRLSNSYGPPKPQIFNIPQKRPQNSYGVPQQQSDKFGQQNSFNNNHQNFNTFGQNNVQQNIPQSTYGAPSNLQSNQQKFITNSFQTTYGAPPPNSEKFQQLHFQRPNLSQNTFNSLLTPPKTSYGTPESNNIQFLEKLRPLIAGFDKGKLTTQYLPIKEANNFQKTSIVNSHSVNFKEVNNFRNNFDNSQQQSPLIPSEQYLPAKEAGNFGRGFEWTQSTPNSRNVPLPNITHLPGNNLDFPRGTGKSFFPDLNTNVEQNNVEIQQVDVRTLYPPLGIDNSNQGSSNFQKNIQANSVNAQANLENGNYLPPTESSNYLPPTTTSPTISNTPIITSPRPVTTLRPTEPSTEQSTEPEINGGPNVAIATAVAGQPAGQQFYLVQPDGQFQRVVYQKTKQEGDTDNEYVADYYFQNIQADPNVVYAPLITLG